jgi:hypothetical protein
LQTQRPDHAHVSARFALPVLIKPATPRHRPDVIEVMAAKPEAGRHHELHIFR